MGSLFREDSLCINRNHTRQTEHNKKKKMSQFTKELILPCTHFASPLGLLYHNLQIMCIHTVVNYHDSNNDLKDNSYQVQILIHSNMNGSMCDSNECLSQILL